MFAFKHSALRALGKLEERRRARVGGWREQGDVEREREKRERQDREELRRVKKCVENTG